MSHMFINTIPEYRVPYLSSIFHEDEMHPKSEILTVTVPYQISKLVISTNTKPFDTGFSL